MPLLKPITILCSAHTPPTSSLLLILYAPLNDLRRQKAYYYNQTPRSWHNSCFNHCGCCWYHKALMHYKTYQKLDHASIFNDIIFTIIMSSATVYHTMNHIGFSETSYGNQCNNQCNK